MPEERHALLVWHLDVAQPDLAVSVPEREIPDSRPAMPTFLFIPAMPTRIAAALLLVPAFAIAQPSAVPDGPSRLLRQPTISATQIAFEYGADLWLVPRSGGEARRLTSTPAIESYPHFSP